MKTIQNKVTFAANVQDVTLVLDNKKSKLLEVEYVKSLVGLDGSIKHVFKHDGKEITIKQDGGGFRMFTSREMFEHDNDVEMTTITIESGARPHHSFSAVEDEDKVGISSVTFINGVPVEVDAPIVEFECHAHRGYVKIEPIYDPKVNIEEYYRSVEHATAFHDYDYYDKEGNKQTAKGRFSFILPDDEQKAVVEELRAVLEKADKAGLRLIFDDNYGRFHVVNSRTSRIEYCGNTDGMRYYSFQEEDGLPDSIKLPAVISGYCSDDSCQMLIEKEEE